MNWWVYVLAILTVVILSVLYFMPAAKMAVSNVGPYELSKKTSVFDNNQVRTFEQTGSATFQGFFYVVPLQRTPTAITCNTPGNPSCEDGRFHTCYCGIGNNCDNCQRNGYAPLMMIGDTCFLEVLPAPDAGRQGKVMTQLAVRTKTTVDASGNPLIIDASGARPNFKSVFEFLALPPIPTQKWVMLTISREGRRFDVYYDGNLVLSQKTLFNIATTSDTAGISVGNSAFSGYGAGFDFAGSVTSGLEVSAKYTLRSDTRGAPRVSLPSDVTTIATNSAGAATSGIKLPSLCPTGGCFTGPTVRPAQPWLDWETSYA
jgi:hypothetical protein